MIIGLSGYAQSGKDTVAQILIDNFGFERIAFADKIRELLYEINPQVGSLTIREIVDVSGWEVGKANPEVRRLLQDLGVGARRMFGEKFWITQALTGVDPSDKIVITDVRFINEARAIKEYENSQIWRVKRPGVGAVNAHVSESEMDHYQVDQIFLNNGTKDELDLLVKTRMRGYDL